MRDPRDLERLGDAGTVNLASIIEPSSAATGPGMTIRGRMLSVTTGQVLGRIEAYGDQAEAVKALTDQIVRVLEETKRGGSVAVLDFHGGVVGGRVSEGLAQALSGVRTGLAVVGPGEAKKLLERHRLSPVAVELDPGKVRSILDWDCIVTGAVQGSGSPVAVGKAAPR